MELPAVRAPSLGGTTEASELARRLAADPRFDATFSLAERTTNPRTQPVRTRIGGFGGPDGLVAWLKQDATQADLDATPPYPHEISSNAVPACTRFALPLASIVRPPSEPQPGDTWITVARSESAGDALVP